MSAGPGWLRSVYKISLKCSCGRFMSPDGHAGRGAFRCGCGRGGVRVVERIDSVRRCTYGDCRILATTPEPLRFCPEHEVEVACRLGHLAGTQVLEHFLDRSPRTRSRHFGHTLTPLPKTTKQPSVAYFARRERLIKIGTTVQLRQRMSSLATVVLATEAGDIVRETQLQQRFTHLLAVGREWSSPDRTSSPTSTNAASPQERHRSTNNSSCPTQAEGSRSAAGPSTRLPSPPDGA